MTWHKRGRYTPALVVFLLFFFFQASSALAQKWSFAAFSDNRNFEVSYRNVLGEINSGGPSDPQFPKSDFVVAIGDIDPVKRTFQVFRETLGPKVPFIPVRGNHEAPEDVRFIIKDILPGEKPPVTVYDRESATFYFDWKNVRLIVIDQYAPYAKGLSGAPILKWVENAIVSAKMADHVFVSFHEPRFAADFHSDPFWSLLLKHSGKVKAVLCGHSHMYGRLHVLDLQGGIDMIDVGNAGNPGHSDGMNTFVQICIDGEKAAFRTVQAPDKTKNFKVTDAWKAGDAKK